MPEISRFFGIAIRMNYNELGVSFQSLPKT